MRLKLKSLIAITLIAASLVVVSLRVFLQPLVKIVHIRENSLLLSKWPEDDSFLKPTAEEHPPTDSVFTPREHLLKGVEPNTSMQAEKKEPSALQAHTGQGSDQDYHKPFLYLTETEKCLRENMRKPNALGDPTVCDILVLSFKEKCKSKSLSHVTYYFNSSATWSQGRGELYYAAKRLNKKYLYYIFIDDDITIKPIFTEQVSNPWRAFEQFLLEYRPPLASTDNSDWKLVERIHKERQKNNCTRNGTDPDYFLAKWFDATVNAFHHDAIEHIFAPIIPVWSRFDNVSWWAPQWYVNIMTDIVFHEQAMLTAHFLAENLIHRSYPKKMRLKDGIVDSMFADIRKVIPEQLWEFADHLQNQWVKIYKNIATTVDATYCHLIPIPRRKIIPYQLVQSD